MSNPSQAHKASKSTARERETRSRESDGSRAMRATVDQYLRALNTPKRRGRKISKTTLTHRLAAAQARNRAATGLQKVLAAQKVRELRGRLAAVSATEGADIESLEAGFVRVAKEFGEQRGLGYAAWRDAGVPAAVLKRAGIARARG